MEKDIAQTANLLSQLDGQPWISYLPQRKRGAGGLPGSGGWDKWPGRIIKA